MKLKFEKIQWNIVVKVLQNLTKLVLAVNALLKTLTVFIYKKEKNESLFLHSI